MFDKKVQEMLTEIMFEEKAEKWVKDNLHSTEEDYKKAYVDGAKFGYNEKYSEFEKELKWERDTKAELAEHLGKANDKVNDLEEKLANADYQLEGRDNEIRELKEQIEKMKCLNEEIIKALKESCEYEWLPAHNGKAKYLYLQTVIDIVNEKFEEIKEK